MSSLLPTPEPADPVEGALGHFEHSNWVKAGLKALDAALFNKAGGTISGNVLIDRGASAVALTLKGLTAQVESYANTAQEVARNAYFNNVRRWKEALTEATWTLTRYDSSGASTGNVLQFANATGLGTVAADPTAALGIATKQYTDGKVVNATGTATDKAPSQAAMTTALTGKSDTTHKHAGADITSGTVDYARLPVGTGAAQVAQGSHIHDDRYYTESEMNTALSGKANSVHTHAYAADTHTHNYAAAGHNHDDLYYQKGTIDAAFVSRDNAIAARPTFQYGRAAQGDGSGFPIGVDASTGDIVIAHRLGRNPIAAFVSADDDGGDASVFASIRTWDSTYIYAKMRNIGAAEAHVYLNWMAF